MFKKTHLKWFPTVDRNDLLSKIFRIFFITGPILTRILQFLKMAASLRIISRGCGVGVKQDRCLYSKLKNHHASYLNLKRNAAVVANIPKKSFDYCYNLTK